MGEGGVVDCERCFRQKKVEGVHPRVLGPGVSEGRCDKRA